MNNTSNSRPIPADLHLHVGGQLPGIYCGFPACWCHKDERRIEILTEALDKRRISPDEVGLYFDGVLQLPEEVFYK